MTEIKVLGSRWGIRPTGFENVLAQRAKLLGLFPVPGQPRPVDFTKLEGLVKDGLDGASDILLDKSHIDARDSRLARTLIFSGVDFATVDYLKVVQYWNDWLRHVDHGGATATDNITFKRKTKDDKTLIVEFVTSELATLVYCLRRSSFPYALFLKEGAVTSDQSDFVLTIERPHEFLVAQDVVGGAGQIAALVLPEMTETQLEEIVSATAPNASIKIVREIGTRKSLGLGLVDTGGTPNHALLAALQSHPQIDEAFFSVGADTSVQQCDVDFGTLPKMARNENVSEHPRLRVAVLLNILSVKELLDDDQYRFIVLDIEAEAARHGQLVSIKVPRPAHNYCPGLQQFAEPGLGKVFLKFANETQAVRAIMELAGRQYNDRTVLCAFYSERDFDLGLF